MECSLHPALIGLHPASRRKMPGCAGITGDAGVSPAVKCPGAQASPPAEKSLGTQASRLRGPRKQREVGCSLRGPRKQRKVGCSLLAFGNKTMVFAVILSPYKPFTHAKRLPDNSSLAASFFYYYSHTSVSSKRSIRQSSTNLVFVNCKIVNCQKEYLSNICQYLLNKESLCLSSMIIPLPKIRQL